MFCHPPKNSPCRKTQESVKIGKMLNFGNPDSGWMRSGFRWMLCHPPLICPCQTTEESLNSLKFFNSGIPDSGRMFSHPPSNCPCQTTQEYAKVEKKFEFRNSGIRADGIGLPADDLLSFIEMLVWKYPGIGEQWKIFWILEFSKSEFRIPDGWVPAAGGGFFTRHSIARVKLPRIPWKYENISIPEFRLPGGWISDENMFIRYCRMVTIWKQKTPIRSVRF